MPVLGASSTPGSSSVFNVKDYGAVGDNSTDDTTAIQTAINALKASVNAASSSHGGQVLFFPQGYYKVTSGLNFQSLTEVRIVGYSGRGGWRSPDGNPPTAISFTGSGSGVAIDMRGSQGCVWDGVSLVAAGGSFTGDLLSLDALTAGDIFGHRIQNCTFRGVSGTPAAMLSMAGNIECSIDNVHFNGGGGTTQVRMVNASAPATWSNANSFRSCSFTGTRTNSVLNPGPQTTFIDCTWEPSGSSVTAPVLWNSLGGEAATATLFAGCGFWDNSSGSWFKSTVATSAMAFTGCKISGGATGDMFDLSSHSGLAMVGCAFTSAGGGAVNIFKAGQNITNGSMIGCYVGSPIVDNHASVFV